MVPEELIFNLVMLGQQVGLVFPGDSTLPQLCGGHQWEWSSWGIPLLRKGDLLVTLIRISAPCWVPQGISGGFLGEVHSAHGVQPPSRDPPKADAIHGWEGCQGLLEDDAEFPHLAGGCQEVNEVAHSEGRDRVLGVPLPPLSYKP